MKTKSIALTTVLFVGFMMFFSFQKEDFSSVSNTQGETAKNLNTTSQPPAINVSNVEQLYSAVNNPANAGAKIVLAPGTYKLSATPQRNGRLDLQHDMSLTGKNGDPKAVIIDVSGVPDSSLQLPPDPVAGQFRTGTIRMGDGSNAIEWMTLQNDPNHDIRSIISTDVITTPAQVTNVRIAHTVVKGGNIGINIINRFTTSNGRTVIADIVDNELTGNTVLPFAAGIVMQNSFGGIVGGVIKVTMNGNYVHGNPYGLGAFNESSTKSSITIKSNADRFEGNALGLNLVAGLAVDPETFDQTNWNSVSFEANGTSVKNNSGTPAPPGPPYKTGTLGGISAHGADVAPDSKQGYANNNKLEITLSGCKIENNLGPNQINVWGARSELASSLPAGTNNTATIRLNGVSKNATVNAIQSIPADPTNKVTIIKN